MALVSMPTMRPERPGLSSSGDITFSGVSDATGDFVTITGGNILRKRTAAETLTDIGALSSSTSSTQDGYFGDIYLKDDTSPSHYLQITDAENLTANHSLSISTGNADRTLTFAGNATISGTNSGDVTLAGENYLSISGQVITAAAVNLSGTNVTGTLAAARFGALTGDVTNSAGSYATTIANNAVTYAKFQQASAGYTIIAKATTGAGNYAELAAGANGVLRRSGSGDLAFGTIPNASLDNSTISGVALGSNLANLTATDSTLTFSGSYNGGTARTVGINLGNANTWTAAQAGFFV